MKIVAERDGTWIELDDIEELSKCYDIMCTCGHPLKYHGFWMSWASNTLFTSQCTTCKIVYDEFNKHGRFTCPHFTPTDDLK
jgi:hypothetical protein